MNQKAYNQFKDSEYNFILGKHELKNAKNWIEWQANQFSACLTVPKEALWARVYWFHEKNSIRNPGTVYYDDQPVNRKDFYNLTMFLSSFFGVSYTSIKFRLQETGILRYGNQQKGGHWTNYFIENQEYSRNDFRRNLPTD